MPKLATANSLDDYSKLNIKQLRPFLSTDDNGVTLNLAGVMHQVNIVTTSCNYGGHRYWFICSRCNRRVGVLYRRLEYSCRHCIGVNYRSQLQQPQDRLFARINALRERLGWLSGLAHGHGQKPKGMHQTTYNRLLSEYCELEQILSASILQQMDVLCQRLDRNLRELKRGEDALI